MTRQRAAAVAALTVWCAASGCTTLQEIPRNEYNLGGERRGIRVMTRDSLQYEFDYVVVANDTLTGFRRQDEVGSVAAYASMAFPVDSIEKLASRRVDWYRTTLVGGVGILAVAGAGLAKNAATRGAGEGNGSGGGGRVP